MSETILTSGIVSAIVTAAFFLISSITIQKLKNRLKFEYYTRTEVARSRLLDYTHVAKVINRGKRALDKLREHEEFDIRSEEMFLQLEADIDEIWTMLNEYAFSLKRDGVYDEIHGYAKVLLAAKNYLLDREVYRAAKRKDEVAELESTIVSTCRSIETKCWMIVDRLIRLTQTAPQY